MVKGFIYHYIHFKFLGFKMKSKLVKSTRSLVDEIFQMNFSPIPFRPGTLNLIFSINLKNQIN